jgi:GNAT superfamily N-acetyltransferase
MQSLLVREAQEHDLRDILEIYAQPGVDDGDVFSEAQAREHWQRFRQYPDYRLFVAVLDGRVVGTFALLIMDNLAHRGARSAVVEDVAVRLDLQGQGIGRRMMEFARERCREAGCYKMALSSNLKRGPAHAFYDSLGFERHGYSFVIRP